MTRWRRLWPSRPADAENQVREGAAESAESEADDLVGEEPEPIEVPITEAIDLHDFAPREVVPIADAYLEAAREKGFREVRLIHGRGKGVQRANLRRMLAEHGDVESFEDAPPERGGWGATLVRLRPREDP